MTWNIFLNQKVLDKEIKIYFFFGLSYDANILSCIIINIKYGFTSKCYVRLIRFIKDYQDKS